MRRRRLLPALALALAGCSSDAGTTDGAVDAHVTDAAGADSNSFCLPSTPPTTLYEGTCDNMPSRTCLVPFHDPFF
jgi:hypothetical protein